MAGSYDEAARNRFWVKVDSTGSDGCWPWTAALNKQGYGRFHLDGQVHLASRVAWMLTYGPLAPGECVLHRCDNPPCCRPAHLFTGTKGDNTADMLAKGRCARIANEDSPVAIYDDVLVDLIRRRAAEGDTRAQIARDTGVSPSHVSRIVNRRRRPIVT